MKVSSVAEMRELDRRAVEEYGVFEDLLMENAGLAACQVLVRDLRPAGRRVLVFCGLGNNGGDGLVVARKLHADGFAVKVLLLGDPGRYRNAAKRNFAILSKLPVAVRRLDAAEEVAPDLVHCDAVVDAIFGTGLDRDVEGLHADVIGLINRSGKPVLSLDIPSGVHGDTGRAMGAAVRARATVTFGLPKTGNLLYPGYGLCGSLFVSHISFPPALYNHVRTEAVTPPALPDRSPMGHKGSFGDVLFIAGASSYFGAPYFAAMGFLKAGGGYARLAAPASVVGHVAARGSEIVFVPQKETASGSLAKANENQLLALAKAVDMVVLGPGLSLDAETQELARRLIRGIEAPLLIDGDGITAACGDLAAVRGRAAPTVLTPHPGEMARLSGSTAADVEADRLGALREAALDLGAVVVLKGANSLVGFPDGRTLINLTGNSGLATAGSGDVLAGAIAAAFGLGLGLEDAVPTGVFLHGLAGDLAAEHKGEDGMTATDVLNFLPMALKLCREGLPDEYLARWPRVR